LKLFLELKRSKQVKQQLIRKLTPKKQQQLGVINAINVDREQLNSTLESDTTENTVLMGKLFPKLMSFGAPTEVTEDETMSRALFIAMVVIAVAFLVAVLITLICLLNQSIQTRGIFDCNDFTQSNLFFMFI